MRNIWGYFGFSFFFRNLKLPTAEKKGTMEKLTKGKCKPLKIVQTLFSYYKKGQQQQQVEHSSNS
jgi:hypothetical protein